MLKLFTSEQVNVTSKTVSAEDVQLRYGFESVTVSASLLDGMTVEEAFTTHASSLGIKADRLANFRQDGNIIPGNTPVVPGAAYTAAVNSESKGV